MFIFRIFSLILILKCLVNLTLSELHNATSPDAKINDTKSETINSTNFKILQQSGTEITPTIVGEGGEKLEPENSQSTAKTTTERSDNVTLASTNRTYGREGEGIESMKKVELLNATMETVSKNTTIGNLSSEAVKPVIEAPVTEKVVTMNTQHTKSPRNRIVPKKGVNFNETVSKPTDISTTALETVTVTKAISVIFSSTTTKPTEAMKQVYKPTVTMGSDDTNDTLTKEKSNQQIPKVPTIEYYQKKEEDNKRSTFVIPIVAVILSVPIVAIVMNILYKRCKEWWSHRHYSRMDFLIDGMYNN